MASQLKSERAVNHRRRVCYIAFWQSPPLPQSRRLGNVLEPLDLWWLKLQTRFVLVLLSLHQICCPSRQTAARRTRVEVGRLGLALGDHTERLKRTTVTERVPEDRLRPCKVAFKVGHIRARPEVKSKLLAFVLACVQQLTALGVIWLHPLQYQFRNQKTWWTRDAPFEANRAGSACRWLS